MKKLYIVCLAILSILLVITGIQFFNRALTAVPYYPIHCNMAVYYEKTDKNLGITKDVFVDKLEQYIKDNELKLVSKNIFNVNDKFKDLSYCVIPKSSRQGFRVNVLYDVNIKDLKRIAVYSFGVLADDYSSHSCMLYLWSCVNSKVVSSDDMKFLKSRPFLVPDSRLINGFMFYRIPVWYSRSFSPEFFVLSVDTSEVKEKMTQSYMVEK